MAGAALVDERVVVRGLAKGPDGLSRTDAGRGREQAACHAPMVGILGRS